MLDDYDYIWDDKKQETNINKHGITFKEAKTAFDDVNGLIKPDPDHSQDEERFILIGFSDSSRLLIVCHCYRDNDNTIRIISARKAHKKEWAEYGGVS